MPYGVNALKSISSEYNPFHSNLQSLPLSIINFDDLATDFSKNGIYQHNFHHLLLPWTLSKHPSLTHSVYDSFNGIVYPAGLGSNSSCLREYVSERGDLQYTLPLRGCNTMSNDNVSIYLVLYFQISYCQFITSMVKYTQTLDCGVFLGICGFFLRLRCLSVCLQAESHKPW